VPGYCLHLPLPPTGRAASFVLPATCLAIFRFRPWRVPY
jgi:hypothetical protein